MRKKDGLGTELHILIVGNVGSGKSIMAKVIAEDAARAGNNVIVFDPTQSTGWPDTATKYADAEAFLEDAPNFRDSYVFIDESPRVWNFDEDAANELIVEGRHKGLLFIIIAQRSRQVRPNARNQCETVLAFRQQISDSKILAEEYHTDMIACASLPKLHGIASDGFSCHRIKVAFAPNRREQMPIKSETPTELDPEEDLELDETVAQ